MKLERIGSLLERCDVRYDSWFHNCKLKCCNCKLPYEVIDASVSVPVGKNLRDRKIVRLYLG